MPSIAGSIVLLIPLSITTTETTKFIDLRPLLCNGSLVKHISYYDLLSMNISDMASICLIKYNTPIHIPIQYIACNLIIQWICDVQ